MPAAFDKMVKAGGKVHTVTGPSKQFGLKAGEYMHVAFMNGNMERGNVKKKNVLVSAMDKSGKCCNG